MLREHRQTTVEEECIAQHNEIICKYLQTELKIIANKDVTDSIIDGYLRINSNIMIPIIQKLLEVQQSKKQLQNESNFNQRKKTYSIHCTYEQLEQKIRKSIERQQLHEKQQQRNKAIIKQYQESIKQYIKHEQQIKQLLDHEKVIEGIYDLKQKNKIIRQRYEQIQRNLKQKQKKNNNKNQEIINKYKYNINILENDKINIINKYEKYIKEIKQQFINQGKQHSKEIIILKKQNKNKIIQYQQIQKKLKQQNIIENNLLQKLYGNLENQILIKQNIIQQKIHYQQKQNQIKINLNQQNIYLRSTLEKWTQRFQNYESMIFKLQQQLQQKQLIRNKLQLMMKDIEIKSNEELLKLKQKINKEKQEIRKEQQSRMEKQKGNNQNINRQISQLKDIIKKNYEDKNIYEFKLTQLESQNRKSEEDYLHQIELKIQELNNLEILVEELRRELDGTSENSANYQTYLSQIAKLKQELKENQLRKYHTINHKNHGKTQLLEKNKIYQIFELLQHNIQWIRQDLYDIKRNYRTNIITISQYVKQEILLLFNKLMKNKAVCSYCQHRQIINKTFQNNSLKIKMADLNNVQIKKKSNISLKGLNKSVNSITKKCKFITQQNVELNTRLEQILQKKPK